MEKVLPPQPVVESEDAPHDQPAVTPVVTQPITDSPYRQHTRIHHLVLVLAVVLLAWLGEGMLLSDPPNIPAGLALLACAGGAFVGLGAWLRRAATSADTVPAGAAAPLLDRFPPHYLLFGMALVCGAAAYWCAITPALRPWPALAAWLAGIGCFLAGARTLPTARDVTEVERWPQWEVLTLAALTLLALLLRIVAIERIPQNFGGDEGEMGMEARGVLQEAYPNPFVTGWLSHPVIWFYIQALSLTLFGNNVFGLRMLSALLGTATVTMLYVFARPLFDRGIALGATALFASYHFHIHFSRLGVNNIADPLFALAAFAALLYGLRHRSPAAFALTGVICGIAQHFYMGSRLTPLLVVAVIIHQALFDRRRLLAAAPHLLLIAAGFALGIGPLAGYFAADPAALTARLAMVGVVQSGWLDRELANGVPLSQIIALQVQRSFGAFTFVPDRSAWYDPRMALLDQASAVMMVLGVALAIARLRKPEWFLLVVWLAGTAVLGGVMLVNSPESPRYVTSAPVLCLLVMLGIARVVEMAGWALNLDPRKRMMAGMVLVVALATWSLNFYFREYIPRRTYGWFNTEVATTVAEYLNQQKEPTYVYFAGPPRIYLGNGTIRFVAQPHGIDVIDPITDPALLPPPPEGVRPLFIFLPEREAELAIVQQHVPGGKVERFVGQSEPATLFIAYTPP